ncbi:DUF2642 domain-containing protein [Paenibacillus sp. SYP-B3998]|uniref:DUF2642 domain-containing protein n=1 Tax=Paenibacillus sp. SYP-B3998 TaxID=2678564 RepID=A0A6G3ZUG2_9BACL|nr:DUF2642 domain-containing protein [Paenibacillus sp. SYP-B3998]NEW05856.1 DUF2642 domain-containing protein [Paenibacillus sp. SYP-B3998]
MSINSDKLNSLIGKQVYVMTRQGQIVDGILNKIVGDKIYLRSNDKTVKTSAFSPFFNPFFNPVTPLVLFDLLAISESPFFFRRPIFF